MGTLTAERRVQGAPEETAALLPALPKPESQYKALAKRSDGRFANVTGRPGREDFKTLTGNGELLVFNLAPKDLQAMTVELNLPIEWNCSQNLTNVCQALNNRLMVLPLVRSLVIGRSWSSTKRLERPAWGLTLSGGIFLSLLLPTDWQPELIIGCAGSQRGHIGIPVISRKPNGQIIVDCCVGEHDTAEGLVFPFSRPPVMLG